MLYANDRKRNIMLIMFLSLTAAAFLYYQTHIFHTLAMFCTCADNIDPRRVDTAVAQYVSKFCDVFLDSIKHTGKQVTKIVRKYFFRVNSCRLAKILHLTPDVCAAYRLPVFCDENLSCCYSVSFTI